MARRLIVGDIHSNFNLLTEVLDKAAFQPENDILYSVGDLCDRGSQPGRVLRYLKELPHFRGVLGNHDLFIEYYLCTGNADFGWTGNNGGRGTLNVLRSFRESEKKEFMHWFASFPVIRVEDDAVVVHGGIPSVYTEKELERAAASKRPVPLLYSRKVDASELEEFLWDRSYLASALSEAGCRQTIPFFDFLPPLNTDKRIFIGHTPLDTHRPFYSEKYHLVAIDTGAGTKSGPLTLLDMDTLEYWQAGAYAVPEKGRLA